MCISDWIQLGSLLVAAVGLVFLIRYVHYTRLIAEATSKPAVIAVQGGHMDDTPHLRNIGNGAALDVEWSIPKSPLHGIIAVIEAGTDSESLGGFPGARTFVEAGLKAGTEQAALVCKYKSITGRRYSSTSAYDLNRGRFSTTFQE